MQSSGTALPQHVTAIFLGKHSNYVRIGQLVGAMKRFGNDLTVVLSDQSIPEGFPELSSDRLFLIDPVTCVDSAGIQTAIRKAIELSPNSDNLLVFTDLETGLPSERDLKKITTKPFDYDFASGCNKLSMRYAKHIVTTGEMPSASNAISNGFSSPLSVREVIRSPRLAIEQNPTIAKFGLVGASGVVVNILVVALLKSVFGVLVANIAGLEISVINNFTWNDRFTFKAAGLPDRFFSLARFYRFIKYNLVSVFSFAVDEFVLYLTYSEAHIYYITSLLIAIATAFVINYFGSSRWAWAKPSTLR